MSKNRRGDFLTQTVYLFTGLHANSHFEVAIDSAFNTYRRYESFAERRRGGQPFSLLVIL